MTESISFRPPQRRGLMFHIVVLVALVSTSGFALFYAFNQPVGQFFVLLLLLSLALFVPVPLVVYRGYALTRAAYRLERDGLRLRWGLRAEDIPLPDIEWVRRGSDMASDLPLPRFSWPGSIIGTVHAPDLGPVEYMAATSERMLLIATNSRVFAISPEDPEGFINAFQRSLEMGSLAPLNSVSVLPGAYLSEVLSDRIARGLLITGFGLTLVLFIGVSLVLPARLSTPQGAGFQILLLPVLSAFIFVTDLTAGLFFYRRGEQRMLAYMLWASSVTSTLMLMVAALVIN